MKFSTENREPREAIVSIALDNDDIEPYLNQAYRQSVRRLSIPGFRKGKAPRQIVEKMYGRGYLLNEAMDTIIQEFTNKAIEDAGIELGGIPSVSLEQFDPPSFVATVPLQPEVDLGDYESIRVSLDSVNVEDAQVDTVIEQLRNELAVWEPVEEGTVQMDDLVNLTIVGKVDESPEPREIVRSEATDYIPRPGTTFPVPGLDEGLVGLSLDQDTEFAVQVPDDFDNSELAGKTVNFEVKIHSIKRKELAELNDEFAKGVGEGFESLGDLKARILEDLTTREEQAAKGKHQDEILIKLVEGSTIKISPQIIESELEHYVHERQDNAKAGRINNMEEYQEFLSWQGMSDEEVHEEARPKVEERLKRAYVLRAVTTKQGFDAPDSEIDSEIDALCASYGDSATEMRALFEDPERRDSIARMVINRKTFEYLSELALAGAKKASAKPKAKSKTKAEKTTTTTKKRTPRPKKATGD
ncbi:MAG: trigger factor [Dehalococcoidia bacterium]|nr:trigger factor [Dehalococcoidia bacterium]